MGNNSSDKAIFICQGISTTLSADSMNWEKATLINAQGIILNEQERMDEAKSVKFDVQTQPSGMYIVRVKTDKGFVNKKVIKE
jgi:Secretion system C-terminal sorting domain